MHTAKFVVSNPLPGLFHTRVYRNGFQIEGVLSIRTQVEPTGGYTVFVGFLDAEFDYSFHVDAVETVRDWEAREAPLVVVGAPA